MLFKKLAVLIAASTMAMLVVLSAGPAFGEVNHIRIFQETSEGEIVAKGVITPSGRINCNAHFRPAEREGGGGGGGAERFERRSPTIESPEGTQSVDIFSTTSKGVQTPSDNVNASCHGQLPEE